MKFSTKTRYGVRAMLEIALNTDDKGVFQKDISINQEISNKYLDQIIHALKVANLIRTLRGKKSGYILTRPAEKITIFDIYNAFESGVCIVDCLNHIDDCKRAEKCAARDFWTKLNDQVYKSFTSNTLADLVKVHKKLNDIPDKKSY
jgi:Rrf2 family protein